MSLHISYSLVLPYNDIRLRGLLDNEEAIFEFLVPIFLTLTYLFPPGEVSILIELFLCGHALELSEGDNCLRSTFANVCFHLLHDNLTFFVYGLNLFGEDGFF